MTHPDRRVNCITTTEARLAAIEARLTALEAAKGAPAPEPAPVAKADGPVIPLGYEACERSYADTDAVGRSIKTYHRNGTEIYLRCILPPEIATHWQPAPGATHEEQRANAWPMGDKEFAGWPADLRGVYRWNWNTCTDIDDIVPVVPRTVKP